MRAYVGLCVLCLRARLCMTGLRTGLVDPRVGSSRVIVFTKIGGSSRRVKVFSLIMGGSGVQIAVRRVGSEKNGPVRFKVSRLQVPWVQIAAFIAENLSSVRSFSEFSQPNGKEYQLQPG